MTDLPCLDATVMMPGSPEVAGNVASNEILSLPSPSSCSSSSGSSSLGSSSSCASSLCSSASSLPLSSRAIALEPAESPYVLGSDPDLWLYRERTPGTVKALSAVFGGSGPAAFTVGPGVCPNSGHVISSRNV
jgi:hypothetical protein